MLHELFDLFYDLGLLLAQLEDVRDVEAVEDLAALLGLAPNLVHKIRLLRLLVERAGPIRRIRLKIRLVRGFIHVAHGLSCERALRSRHRLARRRLVSKQTVNLGVLFGGSRYQRILVQTRLSCLLL